MAVLSGNSVKKRPLVSGKGGKFIRDRENGLLRAIPAVLRERQDDGLEGLVGGLDSVIITTEPDRLERTVGELLRYTGFACREAFDEGRFRRFVLTCPASASIVVQYRKQGENPFLAVNRAPVTGELPNTRLETFVFTTPDIWRYVEIQRERGVIFLQEEIEDAGGHLFIQTPPSRYTGNSLGFIQWRHGKGRYATKDADSLRCSVDKPDLPHLENIFELDHTATRVRAEDRNAAILEFLSLTDYHYDFAVYVKSLNSVTSVARLSANDFAMVFTSGITQSEGKRSSGPTEQFIRNYGTRVHHMAFRTEHIEETFAALKADGMEFLIDLVGSENEGLMQTFSVPSGNTLIVNEYIHRYGGFDGFFTRSNVERLTKATERQ
jgi:hypothetical protein